MKSTQPQFADWPTLREELVRTRRTACITQSQLAARTGYSLAALSYWESGRGKPKLQGLIDWANALELDIVFVRRP